MKLIRLAVAGVAAALTCPALADVKLPAVFSDNMVLQRAEKCPVFGWADKGEKVTVKVGGNAPAEATAGEDGKRRGGGARPGGGGGGGGNARRGTTPDG